MKARREWCMHTKNRPDVSVLHSADSFYAQHRARTEVFPFRGGCNVMYSVADALEARHILYEIIPDWKLDEEKVEGKVLIVEDPFGLKAERIASMKRYVEDGGTLLVTGQALITGGPDMRELLGIEHAGIRPLSGSFEVRSGANESSRQNTQDPVVGIEAAFLYQVKENNYASVVLEAIPLTIGAAPGWEWHSGDLPTEVMPLLTVRELGKGKACYCSVPLFTLLGLKTDEDASETGAQIETLTTHVLELLLPAQFRALTLEAPPDIHVTYRVKSDVHIIHLLNMAKGNRSGRGHARRITDIPRAEACSLNVRIPRAPRDVSLEPGARKPLESTYADGLLKLTVPGFPIHQMVVMKS